MSGFDDPGIFYSDSFGGDAAADEGQARKSQLQRRFKEFLRQYRVGTDRTGFTFKYSSGAISAYCDLHLPGSSDPRASAS
uniref:Minichromosome maintenance complex component 5 n=1 Tax=Cebus imitator TaxID=2715852 RepID=A0A2K5RYL6_CEBIM